MNDRYIEFKGIKKAFNGVTVLENVNFSIRKGEIHAIMGENGAGKSTLLNLLHGVHRPTDGAICIDGVEKHFHSIHDAIKDGIAKVHQEISVIPELTVMQNLMLNSEPHTFGWLDKRKMYRETELLLQKLGCNFPPDQKIGLLSTGHKQMIQIAKALRSDASVISFDEPTASLSDNEVEVLFKLMRELNQNGITILYISHKMDEIFKMCDRATVLRDGKYINTFDLKNTSKEDLIRSMVGRDVSMFAKRMQPCCAENGNIALKVEALNGPTLKDISFELRKGEILGFFGLVGAQRTELMKTLFGALPHDSGRVYHNGREITIKTPHESVREGIALLTENRKEEGFVKDMNNADNMALASLEKVTVGGLVSDKRKRENAMIQGKTVNLTPNDPDFFTRNLSGGNAQKVVLGKWLSTDADIIILDEPTKGIDVGAKTEIYGLMEDILRRGKSIIMVSSELTEVMGMSDRILVMHDGEIVKEFGREAFDEKAILTYAVGVE